MGTGSESQGREPADEADEHRVTDALRAAVSETLAATAGSASQTRDRAAGMVDDLVRRGRDELERGRREAAELAKRGGEATGDLAKRGQEAGELARRGGEGIAKRGQEAGGGLVRRGGEAREELARRFEAFEARLASVEELLKRPVETRREAEPASERTKPPKSSPKHSDSSPKPSTRAVPKPKPEA
ncbi:MAG: hypothetical protein H0W09_06415 [Solirubrobacterales bacterium]|nr:hypothetical protein [Solirubrobacterales bacterium]